MARGDTTLGGPAQSFPDTTWGLVSKIRGSRVEKRRIGFEKLSQRYWKPVYHYIRAGWAKSNEDAKDLTQALFLWLMEGDEVLTRFEPDRGSFRHYLKGILRNFVRNQDHARMRLKRGGGKKFLNIHDDELPLEQMIPDPKGVDPEKLFDRAWMQEVVKQATLRVRDRFMEGKRAHQWEAFEAYDLAPLNDRPTYSHIANRLNIKESDVRNYLFATREKVRQEIRAELCDTVSTEEELQQEWDSLFG